MLIGLEVIRYSNCGGICWGDSKRIDDNTILCGECKEIVDVLE